MQDMIDTKTTFEIRPFETLGAANHGRLGRNPRLER
jgi:hypothetical protein